MTDSVREKWRKSEIDRVRDVLNEINTKIIKKRYSQLLFLSVKVEFDKTKYSSILRIVTIFSVLFDPAEDEIQTLSCKR